LTGSLPAFIRGAFGFNLQVYSRYSSAMTTNYLLQFFGNAASGLNMLSPVPLPGYSQVPAWLFSPVVYKLAIIGFSLVLLLSRRYLAAAFVYLFAAAALTHQRTHFDYLPVVMLASLGLGSLAALPTLLGPDPPPASGQGERGTSRLFHPVIGAGAVLLVLALSISSLAYPLTHREMLSYQSSFSAYELEAQRLLRLGCGQAEMLGYYPGNPYIQFLTRLPPLSRYVFLWPWVAEVGQGEVIAVLQQNPRAIVYLDERTEVWGRPAGDFLAPLLETLERSYIQADERTYLSPALSQACRR
jgi:hypothetical protein